MGNLYMLWHCNPKNNLSDEVTKALEHYQKKYGNPPSIVMFNDKVDVPELPVTVKKEQFVLAEHILVGENKKTNETVQS